MGTNAKTHMSPDCIGRTQVPPRDPPEAGARSGRFCVSAQQPERCSGNVHLRKNPLLRGGFCCHVVAMTLAHQSRSRLAN
jgi:hypothetical protein